MFKEVEGKPPLAACLSLDDIQIRDPFVLVAEREQAYYLYGTTDKQAWAGKGGGFDAYRSRDLRHWEGPFPVFRPTPGFWGEENFWAPEVHVVNGSYYMLASFKAKGRRRATHLLTSSSPLGPFLPLTEEPLTPAEWDCLDGTLHVDRDGVPWIVYCREWLQTINGEMYAQRLMPDLSRTVGEPELLFTAQDAPWVVETTFGEHRGFVTDGPFLLDSPLGELWMLWSSHGKDGYAMGMAQSESGRITGPWRQEEEPLYRQDGGHGMLFRTLEGNWCVSLHQPNESPDERARFVQVSWSGGKLMLDCE